MTGFQWGRGAVACVGILLTTSIAWSQKFPDQPIRVIGLYAPGSPLEAVTRYLGQKLTEGGWPVMVYESRPGAYGTIGALAVKSARPDGYTLVQADTTSHAVSVSMVHPMPYDPVADFTPISMLWEFPSFLAVRKDFPANSVKELIEYAKTRPGGIAYASQGSGSGGHILGALFEQAAGVRMVHVPYRGPTPAMTDFLAGQNDFFFTSGAVIKQLAEEGKVKLLATSSKRRLEDFPDVPTMAEVGYPTVFLDIWFGLMGPANMPDPVVATVRQKIDEALRRPEMQAKIREFGWRPKSATPDEFRSLIKSEIVRLGEIMKQAGVAVGR